MPSIAVKSCTTVAVTPSWPSMANCLFSTRISRRTRSSYHDIVSCCWPGGKSGMQQGIRSNCSDAREGVILPS